MKYHAILLDEEVYKIWTDGKVEKMTSDGWGRFFMKTTATDRREIVKQIREKNNAKRRMAGGKTPVHHGD
jgi:hypothetical protein